MYKMTNKVCNFCLYNLREEECSHKKMNAKQECENFIFVVASNIPYRIIEELSNLDMFYDCLGEAMELIFNSVLNSRFFIFTIDLNEKIITITDKLNDIIYDEVFFSEITLGDDYVSFESSDFKIFLSIFNALKDDDMICQIKFNGLDVDEDYFYLGRNIGLEKKRFGRTKNFRISYERFPKTSFK